MKEFEVPHTDRSPMLVETRIIGEQVLRVIRIPAEPIERIKERDHIMPEYVGTRPMVTVTSHDTGYGSTDNWTSGRRAPKYTSGQS